MGIKRYFASKDNTISNAFKENLSTRATGSNMGASDILETFVIHGQTTSSVDPTPSAHNATNAEQSRAIIQFPVTDIQSDITNGVLPSQTGSIQFVLKMYNAPHGNSTPMSYSLDVCMVSQSWNEGTGLDMDNYSDHGYSNWLSASSTQGWEDALENPRTGASFVEGSNTSGSFHFETGLENLSLDVSDQVYKWLDPNSSYNLPNNGFLIKFPDSIVSGSESYYTKMFFSRTSEFFFYRPVIEARWDSARKDNRGNFLISSSLATGPDNLNTLFLYNVVRGQLANIPTITNDKLHLSLYSGTTGPLGARLAIINDGGESVLDVTGGLLVENGSAVTGVYTASFASTSSYDDVFDLWHTGSGVSHIQFFSGSFVPNSLKASEVLYDTQYVTTVENLQDSYVKGQNPRLRLFSRNKDWSPNIYTVATKAIVPTIIEDAYYSVSREIDGLEIVGYGTGSAVNNYSRLSYDVSGNYFELDTSLLEPGYAYNLRFAYYLQGDYREQPEVFKFRIKEDEV
jgi:hypothetical protein